MDIDRLESAYPAILGQRDVKFVDEGAVASAAGISAGSDLSLHLNGGCSGDETSRGQPHAHGVSNNVCSRFYILA
jgi:transcriptional regulator GlxA family with amidase domain